MQKNVLVEKGRLPWLPLNYFNLWSSKKDKTTNYGYKNRLITKNLLSYDRIYNTNNDGLTKP